MNKVIKDFNNMRSRVMTVYDGDGNERFFHLGVDEEKNTIYMGGATNSGINREYEVEIDPEWPLDVHIDELYEMAVCDIIKEQSERE